MTKNKITLLLLTPLFLVIDTVLFLQIVPTFLCTHPIPMINADPRAPIMYNPPFQGYFCPSSVIILYVLFFLSIGLIIIGMGWGIWRSKKIASSKK